MPRMSIKEATRGALPPSRGIVSARRFRNPPEFPQRERPPDLFRKKICFEKMENRGIKTSSLGNQVVKNVQVGRFLFLFPAGLLCPPKFIFLFPAGLIVRPKSFSLSRRNFSPPKLLAPLLFPQGTHSQLDVSRSSGRRNVQVGRFQPAALPSWTFSAP